jgi:hypothetical protein
MISGKGWMACAACLAVAGLTTGAQAQERLQLEPQAGVAVPLGAFRQYATYGAIGGLDLGYRATPGVTLHLSGSYVRSQGASIPTGAEDVTSEAPGFRQWNALVGIESRLFSPSAARGMRITLDVGGGLAHLSSLPFMEPGTTTAQTFVHTYPQAQGLMWFRYDPKDQPRLGLFVGAGARLLFAKQADTAALAALDPTVLQPFSTAVTVPVTLGLRVGV